ncbi:MAG: acyl-CoA dehydrogenase family protein [Gammaproteobacteria bacterium]|nr:acyl-CoA dehydrogenase family protein [Gammaproteobacteria bacterium]
MQSATRTLFAEEHEIFRRSVAAFIDQEIRPHHETWEDQGCVTRELWRKAGAAGLLCCDVAEAYGGPGADFLYNTVVIEELARSGFSGPAAGFGVHSDMASTYISGFGSEHQRKRYLPGMCAGTTIVAIAMTEPGAGSDLQGMQTYAERDGDEYVISGQKTFISNGQLADVVVLACKTDRSQGARGVSLIIVETEREGFRRGRNLKKLGMKAQDTSELFFDGVRVPVENRLGEEGQGFKMLMKNLARERLVQAIRACAQTEAVIEWTIEYTRERKAFGKTIADFQNTRFELADIAAQVAAGRALVDQQLQSYLRGELDAVAAAKSKLFLTQMHCAAVDRCLQLFGGYGYMWEYPITRAYADARVSKIAGGSVEIMKEIIARDLFS